VPSLSSVASVEVGTDIPGPDHLRHHRRSENRDEPRVGRESAIEGMPGATGPVDRGMTEDATQDALLRLLSESHGGVLITLKRDGRPQLSNVTHAYHPDERIIRVSLTDDRAKTRNLRRDPRASYHVTTADRWAYTVAEGTADLTPVAQDPHDDTVEELVRLYRDVQGEHPDWDDYRAAMVRDRRLVLRLRVERAYGIPARG
jgi:PPOX class probable F420-dependent enzyme